MNNLNVNINEIYYQFLSIESHDYAEKIDFVQRHYDVIDRMDDSVRVSLLYNYLHALYEKRKYSRVINMCSELLVEVMDKNIIEVDGEDIYIKILFYKCISHYQLDELKDAKHISSELIKMNPDDSQYQMILSQIIIKENQEEIQIVRAITIGLFLVSAGVIAVELFLVSVFYEDYTKDIRTVRNVLFFSGLALIIGYQLLIKKRCYKAIIELLQK